MTRDGTSTPTLDALALLTLPGFDSLVERQVRGIACVWDGIPLVTANAVDLGPRQVQQSDEDRRWYPRGCRHCVHDIALRELHLHAPTCPLCKSEARLDECGTGTALRRLMREYRR
ncbi:hypothetical protein ACIGMX_34365 [Streptomyces aquilus]|uniref:hypothetical protein n=1 Tax=Streptomyces aquilus TaxID=2548456 RepID=UPI0037D51687